MARAVRLAGPCGSRDKVGMADYPQLMPDAEIKALLGEKIGGGGSRNAYEVKNDPLAVIKVAKLPFPNAIEWFVSNWVRGTQWESAIGRCYAISKSGLYLVMERLDNITEAQRTETPTVPSFVSDVYSNNFGINAQGEIKIRDYRHGLRASELTDLRWDQVEFSSATLHVRRVKQGTPSTHPILGDELRALAQASARTRSQVALRVHVRTRHAVHHGGVCAHGRARRCRGRIWLQGSPAHAATRLRLRAGQQGSRHPRAASLPGPQEHSAHGQVHRIVA